MTSEDNFADDELSRRSSRADFTDFEKRKSIRRGSSVVRMMSEEQHDSDKSSRSESSERSENADKFRKSIDNGYKHSLESISEYKTTKMFSTNTFYPSLDSPTLDCLSDFAHSIAENLKDSDRTAPTSSNYLAWLETVNNEQYGTPHADSDSKSGEWNYFWTNYNSPANQYFSSPYLCPSNSIEDLSMDSNCTTQMDKGGLEKIAFTLDEVNEALYCTQRVTDILKDALKRAEESDGQNSSSKEEKTINSSAEKKNTPKSSTNSCIDVILNHTGVADILKKVLNKRREVLMPSSESPRSYPGSARNSFDSTKK